MKLDGKNLILFYYVDEQWRTLAYATACELTINAELIKVGSKTTGKWSSYKLKRLGWSASTRHLLCDTLGVTDPFAAIINGTPLLIQIGSVSPHIDAVDIETYVPTGIFEFTGTAFIENLNLSANNGDKAVYTISLRGSGLAESTNRSLITMLTDETLTESSEKPILSL